MMFFFVVCRAVPIKLAKRCRIAVCRKGGIPLRVPMVAPCIALLLAYTLVSRAATEEPQPRFCPSLLTTHNGIPYSIALPDQVLERQHVQHSTHSQGTHKRTFHVCANKHTLCICRCTCTKVHICVYVSILSAVVRHKLTNLRQVLQFCGQSCFRPFAHLLFFVWVRQ